MGTSYFISMPLKIDVEWQNIDIGKSYTKIAKFTKKTCTNTKNKATNFIRETMKFNDRNRALKVIYVHGIS